LCGFYIVLAGCLGVTTPGTSESLKEKPYTMRRIITLALLALLCIFLSGGAYAQRLDGTLRVTVTDKSGGTIEDARVTVTNEATNVSVPAESPR